MKRAVTALGAAVVRFPERFGSRRSPSVRRCGCVLMLSAFNALTLTPAFAALLLRPRKEMRGPLGAFSRGFNHWFARATDG